MKRLVTIGALLLTLTTLLSGCGDTSTFKHLTHDEARSMLAADPHVIILDVRTPEEFDKRHVAGAVLLPIDDLRAGDFSKLPDKNATIIIYCWTGRRAEDAAQILVDNGYTNVFEMGGIVDWTGSVAGNNIE